ncbi:BspA family leucine-rich repeat surface protein, partial [Aquimarina aggregata]|uniref:BspA family leucine-rich repeat surface protein n=1 Tax=Aquimarina aggregata TaxID=1642818 RepID=UPI002491ACD9
MKSIKPYKRLFLVLLVLLAACSSDDDNTTPTGGGTPTPVISVSSSLEFSIDENVASGTSIGSVEASVTPDNADLAYRLASQSVEGAIAINEANGEITVADMNAFDFETNAELMAEVTVAAEGAESQNVAVTIGINDIEVVVNAPSDQSFVINENPAQNTSIGMVAAMVTPATETIMYNLVSQSVAGAVTLNETTGELTVLDTNVFNAQTNPQITLEVMAMANEAEDVTLTVTITVIGASAFVTTWETTVTNETITIPINPNVSNYNYTVDWGDGTMITGQTTNAQHTYSNPGVYIIIIEGSFPALFQPGGRLKTLEQWGDTQWQSMRSFFEDARNLVINDTAAPDLSNVTNMNGMFREAINFNSDISNWDVSNVTNMNSMFLDATSFNQDIGNWDVSNVTNMDFMFFEA